MAILFQYERKERRKKKSERNNENDRYRELATVYMICMLNFCKQSQSQSE